MAQATCKVRVLRVLGQTLPGSKSDVLCRSVTGACDGGLVGWMSTHDMFHWRAA